MFIAIASAVILSCGGSDDNDDSNKNQLNPSALIGTWRRINDKGLFVTLYSDGTCDWGGHSTYSNWELTSDGKMLLTRTDRSEGVRIEQYIVEFKNNQLHLTFPDGRATEYSILEKVDIEAIMATVTKDFFIGNWKYVSVSGGWEPYKLDLSSNGSCKYDNTSLSGKGSWNYNSETRVLTVSIPLYNTSNGKYSYTWNYQFEVLYVSTDEWEGQRFAFRRES